MVTLTVYLDVRDVHPAEHVPEAGYVQSELAELLSGTHSVTDPDYCLVNQTLYYFAIVMWLHTHKSLPSS